MTTAEKALSRSNGAATVNHGPPHLPGFLRAVAKARSRNLRDATHAAELLKAWGSEHVTKAAMNEASGPQGGYLVPPQLSLKLLRALAEKSFIYPRATKVEMTSRTIDCPTVNSSSTATAGTSPFFGGMAFSWTPEANSLTQTEPLFGTTKLTAWDLVGYSKVSNQFLSDAGPEAEDFLVDIFARAAAWQAEYAFLRGNGAGSLMPLGMLNAKARIFVDRGAGNQITATDIAAMEAKLMPEAWQGAIWACSPSARAQLAKMSTWQLNAGFVREGGAVGWLDNLPLYMTDKLPALGTAGDLMLFDPSLYVIGVRQEVVVDASPHVLFQTNQTMFRVWIRCDGTPWIDSTVTLADGQTASSIVALK